MNELKVVTVGQSTNILDKLEVGQPVLLQWVKETAPDIVEFAGLTNRESFLIWKPRSYGKSRHELWIDEIGYLKEVI